MVMIIRKPAILKPNLIVIFTGLEFMAGLELVKSERNTLSVLPGSRLQVKH